jgi:hypothetical protein
MPYPGFKIAEAFAFAERNGVKAEVAAIRSHAIHLSIGRRAAAVRKGHLIALFEERGLMEAFVEQHWPARNSEAGQRRYDYFVQRRALNERRLNGDDSDVDIELDLAEESAAFVLEAQLRDFIAANLSRLQIGGKRLTLFQDHAGHSGVEYPTAVGPIDILAVDEDGRFVVFELKLNRGPDRALGQLARYMGWVKVNVAAGQKVIGVAVASSIDERLRYAACVLPDVVLFEYEVEFRLRDVASMDASAKPLA